MMEYKAFTAEVERMRAEHQKALDETTAKEAEIRKEWERERRQHVMVESSIILARQRTVDRCKEIVNENNLKIDNAMVKAKNELRAEQARYSSRVHDFEVKLAELSDERKCELCEYSAKVMKLAGVDVDKKEGGEG